MCVTGRHHRPADPDQLTSKLLRDKIMERILAETVSITKIYDKVMGTANLFKGATAILSTLVEYHE